MSITERVGELRDGGLVTECALSNDRYRVLLTASGTGYSSFDGEALTAWSGDRLEERDGYFVYCRDDDGAVWSLGLAPTTAVPERYEARARDRHAEIVRLDHGIESRLEVCVPPEAPLEIRRITLVNRTARARRIEITSYAEVVLQSLEAHASHPAFSRLFVQTELDADHFALLARRRPRGPGERHAWLAHALVEIGSFEHETDRARFLGRGRSLARPRALDGVALSGTTGNVLDPIVSLRRTLELAPGATGSLTFLLAADHDRASALARLSAWRAPGACDRALAAAAQGDTTLLRPRSAMMTRAAASPTHARDGDGPRATATPSADRARPKPDEALGSFNGFGGFSPGGDEYVLRLAHRDGEGLRLPPRPWVNVIANEIFGTLVSETGAGVTWSQNSRERRLTPWSNDAVLDPHGEAFYVRDEESGAVWSPMPGPIPAAADYEVRHGFGFTAFRHASHGLDQETVVFVARHDPVKRVHVRIANRGDTSRALSVYAWQRLVLGGLPDGAGPLTTAIDEQHGVALARRPDDRDFGERVAFAAAVLPEGATARFTCDRASFLGLGGAPDRPRGPLSGAPLDGRAGDGVDPCFAEQVRLVVPPGAEVQIDFLLGDGASLAEVRDLLERHRAPGAGARALAEVREFWTDLLSAVRIETPVPAIDRVMNGWLGYQTLSCRMWGRTAFYQSGGAFGFRDQLQDSLALAWLSPAIAREQILLHAAHQFVEGDVLHWWHPPADRGLRTRFADDLLWLPALTATYVRATGDAAILDERLPFVTARPLEAGEDEAYLDTTPRGSDDLYTHCCRAIDRSLATGAHGLPLFGSGDWNDGMNRVGREGRGESVWMGFFLVALLEDFDALCERRGDDARRARHRAQREALARALEANAWDGEWYLRGFYDDGAPLGSSRSDECRIDALVQAWSVISGVAPVARAAMALDAVEHRLITEEDGLIRLLDPPFENTAHDPGYIKGYVTGVRENGGQYTHAALWVVQAFARLGRRERAARLLEALSPVTHAANPERALRYGLEPYVVAADVYGAAPHVGRGGWSWYTGSAGWMMRVTLESVLGLSIEGGESLVVRPCVPDEWPGFRVDLRLPGDRTHYAVSVTNPNRNSAQVVEARLDGRALAVDGGAARVPLMRDGAVHRVEIVLG